MIKAIVIVSVLSLGSTLAAATDPAPDHIGVYFDTGATVTDLATTPGVPFSAYVIITNPTGADVRGVEFSYRFVVPAGSEGALTRLENEQPFHSVDIGNSEDVLHGDHIIGIATPLPPSAAVVITTWQLVLSDDVPVNVYLGPASVESIEDGLPEYAADDSVIVLVPSSGDVDVPVATINGGVTDVPGVVVHNAVVLEPCRPNPFNPRTTISFSLDRKGSVWLSVHDIAGKTVRVLMAGDVVDPGEHEVEWDGRDGRGRAVASGIYLCRIEALGLRASQQMILVR